MPSDYAFLGSDSSMAARIRSFDWRATALGPVADWPECLKYSMSIMLASPIPTSLLWGDEGLMIYNDAYIEVAGNRHPGLLGRSVLEQWPEVADFNRAVLDTCMAGGNLRHTDLPLVLHRNGQPEQVWLSLSFSPIRDEQGQPRGVLAMVAETTARVRTQREREATQQALAAANERIQLALNSGAVIGTWVWDVRNDVITADGRLGRAFDVPPEAVEVGVPLHLMLSSIHPDHRARVQQEITATVRDGGSFMSEYLVRADDGQYRWVEASGFCETGVDGMPSRFPGVLLDIDARKRTEEALRQLTATLEDRVAQAISARDDSEEQLRQSQKMEAIGKLTGGVAHDFNNVLQVISGNLHLLSMEVKGNERLERRLKSANTAVSRGAQLASQLLAFARRQPLNPVPTNLGKLVQSMDEMLQRVLGDTVQVRTVVADGLWNTLVDGNQLENALLNLAINARDAMDGHGNMVIEAGNATLDDEYCSRHPDLTPGDFVMLAVSDNGRGMSADVARQAFEPFFTTKPAGKGTGLGLSMVHGFVNQSGGHVHLYSEVDVGTTIRLYLPRSACAETEPETRDEGPLRGGNETILLVEDDEQVRITALEMLRGLGYTVLNAQNPDEAMRLLESGATADMLFTDVVMPGKLKSPELAERARRMLPALEVLFTSGYTADAITHDGRLDAGVELLSKPYSREAMARKVRQVLDRRVRAANQPYAGESAAEADAPMIESEGGSAA